MKGLLRQSTESQPPPFLSFLPPPPALAGDSCECQVYIHATRGGDSARFLIRRIDIDTFLGSEHHQPKRAAGIVDNNVNSFECPLTERKKERVSEPQWHQVSRVMANNEIAALQQVDSKSQSQSYRTFFILFPTRLDLLKKGGYREIVTTTTTTAHH